MGDDLTAVEADALDQVEDMEHYISHDLGPSDDSTQVVWDTDYWRCFHCGEVFKADQEDEARKHFGTLPPSRPGCWYGKDELIALLRAYEDVNHRLLSMITLLVTELESEAEDNEDA